MAIHIVRPDGLLIAFIHTPYPHQCNALREVVTIPRTTLVTHTLQPPPGPIPDDAHPISSIDIGWTSISYFAPPPDDPSIIIEELQRLWDAATTIDEPDPVWRAARTAVRRANRTLPPPVRFDADGPHLRAVCDSPVCQVAETSSRLTSNALLRHLATYRHIEAEFGVRYAELREAMAQVLLAERLAQR